MCVLHVLNLFTLLFISQSLPDIVSVPDLHGDYANTLKILEDAGLIDAKTGAWIGGSTTLVQTGDIADRGPDSQKIFNLFDRLSVEAKAKGGSVINLLGNHELMNIQGDVRYVNPDEIASVGGPYNWNAMWGPQSALGRQVRNFKAVAKVGPVLFVHAGLTPDFLQKGHTLEDVNREMHAAVSKRGLPLKDKTLSPYVLNDGPLWTRFYSMPSDPAERCQVVQEVLEKVGATRMVVGHTPQIMEDNSLHVNAVCGGSLILADTAVSRAYGGVMSYIRYTDSGNQATVHYPSSGTKEVLPSSPLQAGKKSNMRNGLQLDKDPWTKVASTSKRSFLVVLGEIIFVVSILAFGIFYFFRPWVVRHMEKLRLK
jgi:hypothetical protein